MKPGVNRGKHWPRGGFPAIGWLGLCLLAGCCGHRPHLDKALMAGNAGPDPKLIQHYDVTCPDVIEIHVDGHPYVPSPQGIGPDGRIELGPMGRVRVEGLTVPEICRVVAVAFGISPDRVHIRVVEYNSQKVYLFGGGSELQEAVAYRGPETVLQLLQRAGGITPGAAPDEVYVVRSRIPDGRQPEVYPVHLAEILMKKDDKTNVCLQPFDQVFIGESRKSCLQDCVPPCLRPFYKAICGLQQSGQPPQHPDESEVEKARRKKFLFRLPMPRRRDPRNSEPAREPETEPPTILPAPRRLDT